MKGVNPAWANLPRRKCDDCGKNYKPKQPLRDNQRGFCCDTCRKSYHKHGGAYRKLRGEMRKMLEKETNDLNLKVRTLVHNEMDHFDIGRINAELKELRQLWIDTESRFVALSAQLNTAPKARTVPGPNPQSRA